MDTTPARLLLRMLYLQGVTVRADGEALRVAPLSKVRPSQRTAIAKHKAVILEVLSSAASSGNISRSSETEQGGNISTLNEPKSTLLDGVPDLETPEEARLRLASEIGYILNTFPNGGAKYLRGGDWRIEGDRYAHYEAVLMASHRRGQTRNGYALEVTTEIHKQITLSEAA